MIVPGPSQRAHATLMALVVLLAIVYINGATFYSQAADDDLPDPYEILGVSRHASIDAIKQRWRSLSKIHHPDKGGAAEEFAALSTAFEILSNPAERRRYDQKHSRAKTKQEQQGDIQKRKDAERRVKMFKKQQEAQRRIQVRKAAEMQTGLLRLVSIDDMVANGILSTDHRFLQNFVGVFVGNKMQEKSSDSDFMFPFPFSGDARNGLQWEEILRTAKIRYNQPTELTRLFGVPYTKRDTPYIVFGRSGDSVSKIGVFSMVQGVADPQEQLEQWVTRHLKSRVTMVNHHHGSVELYLVRDQSKPSREGLELVTALRPGFSVSLTVDIGDKIIVVDSRVDTFPGSQAAFDTELFKGSKSPIITAHTPRPNPQSWYFQNPAILGEFIISGPEITLEIPEIACFDLSLKCQSWILSGTKPQDRSACQQQPEFMHAICPASCGVCHRSNISLIDRILYIVQHAPIYHFPAWIRPIVRFSRFAAHDMDNIITMRRTVAAAFFAVGGVLGLNSFVIPRMLFGSGIPQRRLDHSLKDILSVSSIVATVAFWGWLHFIAPNSSLRRDWFYLLKWDVDAIMGLLVVGIATALVASMISAYWTNCQATPRPIKLVISGVGLSVFYCLVVTIGSAALRTDPTEGRRERWNHLWQMRKNVAFGLFLSGLFFGHGIFPIFRLLQGRPELFLVGVLDVGLILTLKMLPVLDPYYITDLHHVLHLRMSGAIPIGIAGLLIGFGCPLLLHLRQLKSYSTGETRQAMSLRCLKQKFA
jgi:curved DNA-binding protein CbpA